MLLTTLLSAKAVAAVGAGVVVLSGGATAAAYAGALPAQLQTVAHNVVGAPAAAGDQGQDDATPEPSETSESPKAADPAQTPDPAETPDASPSGSPVGPDATGPAAFGLCNAYSHGGVPQNSTAYQSLVKAATGGTIEAYCATVPHPGKPSPTPSASSTDTSSPAAAPTVTKHGKSKPNKSQKHHGRPSTAPGRPTS